MPEDPNTYASKREIAELRTEIRRLREERQPQQAIAADGNGGPKAGEDGAPPPERNPEQPQKPHPLRKFFIIGAILLVLLGVILWWMHARRFESTDDAEVDGHLSAIAARISGVVTAVYVEENQPVKAGQVLVELDPRDYRNAVDQARGQLSEAEAQTQAEQPNFPVTQVTNRTNVSTAGADVASAQEGVAAAQRDYQAALAKVREAQANNAKAQADVERYRPLAEKDEIPRAQFDQVMANAKALTAAVESAQASAAASSQKVEQHQAELAKARQQLAEARENGPHELAIRQANVASRRAAAAAARAQLDQALLNLSYCRIVSPVDGIVAKRAAEVGQHVAPGQEVVLVSQINGLWVTANFKETQLRRIRPGQAVTIHVDALGADFTGVVDSMPGASGAITSLLPPENATGNFVKVVQRMPVRIRFNTKQTGLDRLRPGMSVEPRVRVV